MLEFIEQYRLPSGIAYVWKTEDDYTIENTLMQDVSTSKTWDDEVRNTLDPKIIWKHMVPAKDKILMTISTQAPGCIHSCKFCDVAPLPFKRNLTSDEMNEQIDKLLNLFPHYVYRKKNETVSYRGKIGYARLGEPAHNLKNVIDSMRTLPMKFPEIKWLPCFNSILPEKCINGYSGLDILDEVIDFKENECNGRLHLQISCNSTDEDKRKELFGGATVVPLEEIIQFINKKKITNRTVALNFIVMEDVPIDIPYLQKLGLNGEKFVVKLIPLNMTFNSEENNLKSYADYSTYEKLQQYTQQFKDVGIPVIMDSIAKCESAGLCCGQLVQQYIR